MFFKKNSKQASLNLLSDLQTMQSAEKISKTVDFNILDDRATTHDLLLPMVFYCTIFQFLALRVLQFFMNIIIWKGTKEGEERVLKNPPGFFGIFQGIKFLVIGSTRIFWKFGKNG